MVSSKHPNPFSPNATDTEQFNPWADEELTPRYTPGQRRALSPARDARPAREPRRSALQPTAAGSSRSTRHDSQPTPTGVRLTARRASARAQGAADSGRPAGSRLAPPIPLAALQPGAAPAAGQPAAQAAPAVPPELFVAPLVAARVDPLGLELPELLRDPRAWMANTQRALALVVIGGCCTLLALLYFGGFLG